MKNPNESCPKYDIRSHFHLDIWRRWIELFRRTLKTRSHHSCPSPTVVTTSGEVTEKYKKLAKKKTNQRAVQQNWSSKRFQVNSHLSVDYCWILYVLKVLFCVFYKYPIHADFAFNLLSLLRKGVRVKIENTLDLLFACYKKKQNLHLLTLKNPDASSAKASADSTIALLSLAQTSTRNRILRAANQTDQSENKAISARHSWEIFKAQTCRDRVLQYRSKACSGKPGIYKNITSRPLAVDSHNLTLKPLKIKTMYWPKWFAKLMHVRFRFSLATSESHIHFFISSLATLGPQLRVFTTNRSMEKSRRASTSLKICVVKNASRNLREKWMLLK